MIDDTDAERILVLIDTAARLGKARIALHKFPLNQQRLSLERALSRRLDRLLGADLLCGL
jgi:hypothetical protein